jgi:hypothetical protein
MTIKEVKNNPLVIGDFVKVSCGGSIRSRDLIWLIVGYVEGNETRRVPAVYIRLVSDGAINTGNNKEFSIGFERSISMTSLKKIDVIVKERGA